MAKFLELGEKRWDRNCGGLWFNACGNLNEVVGGLFRGKKKDDKERRKKVMLDLTFLLFHHLSPTGNHRNIRILKKTNIP